MKLNPAHPQWPGRPAALCLSLAMLPAMASENPGAHVHGHANLQLAVEGQRIDLMLISPAYNLFGFEHQPANSRQEQLVQKAEVWAATIPAVNTDNPGCSLVAGSLYTSWNQKHHDNDNNDHDHEQHNSNQVPSHSDIELNQTLDCPGLTKADRLETPLMERFPGLKHLDVQWATPGGQGGARLKQGDQLLPLGL